MMSTIKIFSILSLVALLVISCYEDKGNYDYRPINEVGISGIEEKYEIERWDTLKIPVEVKNSLGQGSGLVYSWYLDRKKIAETRDLNYVISEKSKTYQGRLEVMDPAADSVRFFQDFEVVVYSQYAKGLLLLSEEEGHPELSFINTLNNPTNEIMYDIYKLENGRKLSGTPLGVEQTDPYSYGGTVFVHTSESSHQLDPILFKEIDVLNIHSFTEPNPVYDMVYCRYEDAVDGFGGAIGRDGKIYPKQSRQNRYMASSLKPVHVERDEARKVDYQLSPMLLNTRNATLAYDNLSGRFMYFYNSYNIPSYDENQYDVVRISDTYVGMPWIGWGNNMQGGAYGFASLFYNPETGQAALARAHTSTGKMQGQDSLVLLSGHHLAADSRMVVNSANNRIYYSDGGHRIYMLNLSDPEFKFASHVFDCSLPETGKITLLKVSGDHLALYVGMVTERRDKYRGDVYKVNIKDGTILEHYARFGGTPVDLIEKVPIDDFDTGGL